MRRNLSLTRWRGCAGTAASGAGRFRHEESAAGRPRFSLDWSQNDNHKTTINVYSLRAKDRPTVSTPVKWAEVEQCLEKGDPSLLVFESDKVLERVKQNGDSL